MNKTGKKKNSHKVKKGKAEGKPTQLPRTME